MRAENATHTTQADVSPTPPSAPEPAPAVPTPPAAPVGPDTASPAATMDGLHGELALGAARYLGTTAGTLVGGRIALQRWWDNFALVGAFHIAADGDDAVAGGATLGARVLGSSGKSGPYAGMGVGLMNLTVRTPYTGAYSNTTKDDKFGGNAYAEIGAMTRGRFAIGARIDLPMFTVSDAKIDQLYDNANTLGRRRTVTHPIGVALELGFLF